MKIASVADVKAKLSAYVKASERGPVLITRNGKAVAALVPITDEDELDRLLISYSPKLRRMLLAARGRIKAGDTVSHDEFWHEAGSSKRTRS
ncbi:MAG TPA: type II toxin-antitoxin system Phd/YefM family antitoxin [Tepidisphaeraceae bacterium]|nr:type II toxin-antitoxin system Phd/YefM family antitoxin [Tepidisphaeraceae bacterium]